MLAKSTSLLRTSSKCTATQKPVPTPSRPSRLARIMRRAQEGGSQPEQPAGSEKADGYIGEDNSGKSNIFPNVSKPFVSSPVTDAAASQGLGGAGGGALVGGAIVVILALAVLVGKVGTGETLDQIQANGSQESLSEIARRLSGTSDF